MKNNIQNIINVLTKYGIIIVSFIVGLIGIFSIFITAYLNSSYNTLGENTLFKFTPGILEIFVAIISLFLLYIFTRKIFKKSSNPYIYIYRGFYINYTFDSFNLLDKSIKT